METMKSLEEDQKRNRDHKRRKHLIYLLWHLGVKGKDVRKVSNAPLNLGVDSCWCQWCKLNV
jgi:hypothetical protein